MIYKYLSPSRLDVLKNATLRATQANALNDPFELKPFFSAIVEKAEILQRAKEESLIEEELRKAYLALPATTRARIPLNQFLAIIRQPGMKKQLEAMFELEVESLLGTLGPQLTDQFQRMIHDGLGNRVGILSFSEIPNDTLMWSHYGQDHKGYVIQFDDSHPFFDRRRSTEDEFFHLRAVEYRDELPVYSSVSQVEGANLLCTKKKKWSYERERRMLIPVDPKDYHGEGEPIHLVAYPRDAVTAVIVGERTGTQLIDAIRATLESEADYGSVLLKRARADLRSGEMVIETLTG